MCGWAGVDGLQKPQTRLQGARHRKRWQQQVKLAAETLAAWSSLLCVSQPRVGRVHDMLPLELLPCFTTYV
jgi:hypothetical protein